MRTLVHTHGLRLALLTASLLLGSGCIAVQPLDGAYSCAKDSDCPSGYGCNQGAHTCWRPGHGPDLGTGGNVAPPDMVGDSLQCHDGVLDGSETDVDCGGNSCVACSTGQACKIGKDCTSGICNGFTHVCAATTCEDGVRDAKETDVDCGGNACSPCADGKVCAVDADCVNQICNATTHTCSSTRCSDGTKDNSETDVDCGGSCPPCLGGKACSVNADCLSGACSVVTHTCAASACENGVKDPGETDIDCGGSKCPACALTKACLTGSDCLSKFCNAITLTCVGSQCQDGTLNGNETDVDCGGSCGNTCKVGAACKSGADCASGSCGANNTCVATQCQDGMKDGSETDKDCGGGTCMSCANGQGCADGNRDCTSKYCNATTKICVANQCQDGTVDGSETDVDCGGPSANCGRCALGAGCKSGGDCSSTWCNKDSLKCVDSQCKDGFKDNGETDVDCGGGATTGCAACGLGKGCGTDNANCMSGFCNYVTSLCVSGACADGRIDGNETDIDCGGGTCNTCDTGKICKMNSDCGSTACDFGPSPHKCVTDACADHHQDNSETDVDCGGGSCSTCAVGKSCTQGADCSTGYCDPASKKCACGGIGQACCTGGACNQPSNLCTGAASCSSSNICVQASPVVCPTPPVCFQIGTCSPSTGQCSQPAPLSGTSCNLNGSDQCIVANSSTCSSGQCLGGTKVPDRCVGNDAQTCNNNTWSLKMSCSNGCTGNGVCNGPPTPTLSAVLDGSDVSVSWGTPAQGVTCTLQRNDNQGAGWQVPLSVVSPCPATAAQPCTAYDRALLRGSYNYQLVCKDQQGLTSTSPPFPATGSLSPATEICAADWASSLEVHAAWPDGIHDKLERNISSGASLNETVGVAYAPPAAGKTNCAPNDHTCGTVFVTSYGSDKVMAFDRRANDYDAANAGSQPPSASERILSIALKDSGATQYKPIGVAVLGNTLIVAMQGSPGFLAGYPLNFGSGTPSPSWYLRGTASAKNKLVTPLAVAVDNGPGTGNGWVFVSNGKSGTTYSITGYKLDDLANPANINASDFVNDVAAPFVTITASFQMDGIAIDPTNHVLYATQVTNAGRIQEYKTTDGTAITSFQGKQVVAPLGLAFLPGASGSGTVYVVDNNTGAIMAFPGGASGGPLDPLVNFTVSTLVKNAAGLAICN